jgi:hypothetical protein
MRLQLGGLELRQTEAVPLSLCIAVLPAPKLRLAHVDVLMCCTVLHRTALHCRYIKNQLYAPLFPANVALGTKAA